MAVQTQPKPTRAALPRRPELRLVEGRRRAAQLHLLTFVVGNALFWTLWGAISVTADRWYWWPVVPVVGWAVVLAGHLWHAFRPATT
jgi:2TM domain-containing protein